MVSIFYDIILFISSQMYTCNSVLWSLHLLLLLCIDIYTLCHSRDILKNDINSRILYVAFGAYAKENFLSEYLIMYILYSCVYIACPVYVLSFIACHLFLLMLFAELNRLLKKFTLLYFTLHV